MRSVDSTIRYSSSRLRFLSVDNVLHLSPQGAKGREIGDLVIMYYVNNTIYEVPRGILFSASLPLPPFPQQSTQARYCGRTRMLKHK
jgi:hypothetical protein